MISTITSLLFFSNNSPSFEQKVTLISASAVPVSINPSIGLIVRVLLASGVVSLNAYPIWYLPLFPIFMVCTALSPTRMRPKSISLPPVSLPWEFRLTAVILYASATARKLVVVERGGVDFRPPSWSAYRRENLPVSMSGSGEVKVTTTGRLVPIGRMPDSGLMEILVESLKSPKSTSHSMGSRDLFVIVKLRVSDFPIRMRSKSRVSASFSAASLVSRSLVAFLSVLAASACSALASASSQGPAISSIGSVPQHFSGKTSGAGLLLTLSTRSLRYSFASFGSAHSFTSLVSPSSSSSLGGSMKKMSRDSSSLVSSPTSTWHLYSPLLVTRMTSMFVAAICSMRPFSSSVEASFSSTLQSGFLNKFNGPKE